MSTTDPKRPGDDPGTGATAPVGAGDTDTGRHAVQRPAPTPPDQDRPAPVGRTTPASAGAPASSRTAEDPRPQPEGPGTPPGRDLDGDGPARPVDGTAEDELFPDPQAPRTPHTGTHVLGVLVGLVLAPAALAVLLLGQSRILRVQADGWDASLELLGIVLVSAGALLLAVVLALGLWTATVPVTAGLVLGVLGGVQLYAPGIARAAVLDLVGTDAWAPVVAQVAVAGASGTTFTVGLLLLTGGAVIALARRHGVRLGAFRERNRTT